VADKGPLQDAQRALKIIYAHAAEWMIDTGRIGIQGSSAGGHLAAMAGTADSDLAITGDSLDRIPYKPHFMILVSPVIDMGEYAHKGSRKNLLGAHPGADLVKQYSAQTHVTNTTPPAFIVHASNDASVSPYNSLLFYTALLENKVPSALYIFPQGGHAIALRDNPGSTQYWTTLCEEWMKEMGINPPKK
jgi:acetyl esterase/lipase